MWGHRERYVARVEISRGGIKWVQKKPEVNTGEQEMLHHNGDLQARSS